MSVGCFMLTMSVGCFMWFLPHRRCQHHRPGWLTATRISTATSVLCVFLCRGRKLKAPQRHIVNAVVYSYFHSDLLFLAVYLLCGSVLLFGWYFDYLKNKTTAKAVYLLCLVCFVLLNISNVAKVAILRPRHGVAKAYLTFAPFAPWLMFANCIDSLL